jgi:peroxiredoxin Q/BCP
MRELRDAAKTFDEAETTILAISKDGIDSHKKFCDDEKLPFDLVADTESKVHEADGFKKMVRALILVDKAGTIRWVDKEYKLTKEEWETLMKEVAELKPKK